MTDKTEKCEWVPVEKDTFNVIVLTIKSAVCNTGLPSGSWPNLQLFKYCPYCGKEIEVKNDGTN